MTEKLCNCCGTPLTPLQSEPGHVEWICGKCDNNLCPKCKVHDKECPICNTTIYNYTTDEDYKHMGTYHHELLNKYFKHVINEDIIMYYCRYCNSGWLIDRHTRKGIYWY